jgi:hypothetical protein
MRRFAWQRSLATATIWRPRLERLRSHQVLNCTAILSASRTNMATSIATVDDVLDPDRQTHRVFGHARLVELGGRQVRLVQPAEALLVLPVRPIREDLQRYFFGPGLNSMNQSGPESILWATA